MTDSYGRGSRGAGLPRRNHDQNRNKRWHVVLDRAVRGPSRSGPIPNTAASQCYSSSSTARQPAQSGSVLLSPLDGASSPCAVPTAQPKRACDVFYTWRRSVTRVVPRMAAVRSADVVLATVVAEPIVGGSGDTGLALLPHRHAPVVRSSARVVQLPKRWTRSGGCRCAGAISSDVLPGRTPLPCPGRGTAARKFATFSQWWPRNLPPQSAGCAACGRSRSAAVASATPVGVVRLAHRKCSKAGGQSC